jgi:hypothetical protein
MNRLASAAICLAALGTGCGGQQYTPYNVFDLGQGQGDLSSPSSQPGADLAMASTSDAGTGCATYTKSSIAGMRQAAKSGCFELDGVVSVATTPITAKSTSIRIVAQDSSGGDYSAIVLDCSDSATAKHPCTAFATAKNVLAGRALTITGFYEKASAAKGAYEYLSIDAVTDTGAGTAPAPATAMLADIERAANKPALWFQKVTVTIGAADTLGMFDFSPAEFKSSSATATCGSFYGFGMLPKSVTGTAGGACSGTTQPSGQTAVNANEVLIGTDFHGTFTANSECSCISMKTMAPYPGLLSAASTLTGTISGVLFYDASANVGYQFLAPLKDADAPISGLSK